MAKKNPNNFRITFTDREMELLKALKEFTGALRTIDVIRRAILDSYTGYFPAYKRDKTDKAVKKVGEKELLTPEQRCEQMGGTVDTVEGMCVIPYGKFGHMKLKKPLSMV